MSELKCCKRCSAFATCDHKGECCLECEFFDPVDMLCMAPPEKKTEKIEPIEDDDEIDPATFLFEDDDEEDDDTSDLPPERDADDDDDGVFDPSEDDDDW